MRLLMIVLAASATLWSGCASQAPSAAKAASEAKAPMTGRAAPLAISTFSGDEKTKMTFCIGLADTAMTVADQKLRGRPMDEVKTYYASRPKARRTVPLVEKVYAATFRSSWDYAVAFFKECAGNMAKVSPDRVDLAAYCMQNGMIAAVAQTYREARLPKDRAYQRFARFEGDTPRSIIDKVYAGSATRSQAVLDTWHGCMAPISG